MHISKRTTMVYCECHTKTAMYYIIQSRNKRFTPFYLTPGKMEISISKDCRGEKNVHDHE